MRRDEPHEREQPIITDMVWSRNGRGRLDRWFPAHFAIAMLAVGPGCGTVRYYEQAFRGQMDIVRLQKPFREVLTSGAADPVTRERLERVGAIRAFAESELGLPAGRSYTRYADLGRHAVVWSVFAAPEFSLEPRTWWYPVVGRLAYRGFFEERHAEAAAAALRDEGFDVFVGEVKAYSTLGWFADPVLNTFVGDPEPDLAELIFHELTHRRVYRRGHTAFNEALATTVAEEGVRRWLASRGQDVALRRYEERLAQRRDVFAMIELARQDLRAIYAAGGSPESMRLRKHTRLEELQKEIRMAVDDETARRSSPWLRELPNNALLNASATYRRHVPGLKQLLHGQCDDDLERFLRLAETIDVEEFLRSDGAME